MSIKAQRRLLVAGAILTTVFALAIWGRIALRNGKVAQPAARAVFGERPDPTAARPVATPQRTRFRTNIEEDVARALEGWNSTLRRGDINAHVAFYAPTVERFFRERDVQRRQVLKEKRNLLRRYPKVRTLEIEDLRVDVSNPARPVATFTKNWEMYGAGRRRFAGSETQRLKLQQNGERWQIVSEEELKVHWVKRS